MNSNKPMLEVKHKELERLSSNSNFRSVCPVCKEGVLFVRRGENLKLSRYDNCVLCGQQFKYTDLEYMGEVND